MDRDDLMSLFNKAQNGDIEAQFTLGQCFLVGDGVEEDSEIAAQCLPKLLMQDILKHIYVWFNESLRARYRSRF